MNTVRTHTKTARKQYTIEALIGCDMRDHGHTAFVGTIGKEHNLFLITYSAVMQADYPHNTWTTGDVTVDRFCDVTISEI